MSDPELLHRLMQTVNFSADDLASNRMGQVTDRQVQSLKRQAWAVAGRTAFLGLVLGAVMLVAGLTVKDQTLSIAFSGAGLIAAPVMIALAGWELRRHLAEVEALQTVGTAQQGKVMSVEGNGRRVLGSGRTGHRWHCRIGDMSFNISLPAYLVFIDDEIYRAYYTPSTNTLLSIEPVGA